MGVPANKIHKFTGHDLFDFWQKIGDRMDEFRQLKPMLQCVYFDAMRYAYLHYSKRILITGIYDDYGLHIYFRAIDGNVDQTEDNLYKNEMSYQQADELCTYINSRYCYDPQRPDMFVAVFGWRDPDGYHDNHIHFQVHPRTIYLGMDIDRMGLIDNV